jgi:outer membrane protein TolC
MKSKEDNLSRTGRPGRAWVAVPGARRWPGLVLVLLLSLSHTPGRSQSLDDYLRMAEEANPELRALHSDYLAALEQSGRAGALPDPTLEAGVFFKPMERFMGNQQADFRLMQMFPWPGMPGVQRDEASRMALMRYRAYEDFRNRLYFQVKSAWCDLYLLRKEIRSVEENLGILEQFERLALVRLEAAGSAAVAPMPAAGDMPAAAPAAGAGGMATMNMGAGTTPPEAPSAGGSMPSTGAMSAGTGMAEVLRVRMESNELRIRLQLLAESEVPLLAEFNRLVDRPADAPVEPGDALPAGDAEPAATQHADSAFQRNPMLRMLHAEGGAAEAQQRMARLEGRPMLGVGVNYMMFAPRPENGMSMGGPDMVMPMFSVSLPVYRKKYRALSKEAELRQQSVSERMEATRSELQARWLGAQRDWRDAGRRVELYRQQGTLAGQRQELLTTAYAAGTVPFEEVLRARQALIDYRFRTEQARVDRYLAVATLEMLAGVDGL